MQCRQVSWLCLHPPPSGPHHPSKSTPHPPSPALCWNSAEPPLPGRPAGCCLDDGEASTGNFQTKRTFGRQSGRQLFIRCRECVAWVLFGGSRRNRVNIDIYHCYSHRVAGEGRWLWKGLCVCGGGGGGGCSNNRWMCIVRGSPYNPYLCG